MLFEKRSITRTNTTIKTDDKNWIRMAHSAVHNSWQAGITIDRLPGIGVELSKKKLGENDKKDGSSDVAKKQRLK